MALSSGDDAPSTVGKYGDQNDFEAGDWVRTAWGTDGIFVSTAGELATIRLNGDKGTVSEPLKDLRHHPDDVQYWKRAGVEPR